MPHEIKLMDAMEGMASLESGSVNLVVTDPPYSSLEKWRNQGTTTRLKQSTQSSNEWFPTVANSYFGPFFEECYRVMRSGSDIYVMCDEETGDVLKPMLRDVGFELRKSLIWWKVGKEIEVPCGSCGKVLTHTNKPGIPGMGYPFRSQWEMILLARKGKRPVPEDKSVRNVLPVPWIKSRDAYPTQKPHELLQTLIRQSSSPGDLVHDPFAGSGSTGYAAHLEGRDFLGFDVQQRALDFFAARKAEWGEVPVPSAGRLGGISALFGRQ